MPKKRKIRVAEPTIVEENDENISSVGNRYKNELFNDKAARSIGEVILEAQKNASLHDKCIQQMHKLYKTIDHDKFIKVMLHAVQYSMTKPVENIATNCILDFCAKLFVSFEQDNNEDSTHPVICDVFKWLLNTTSAESHVRFRMCQFVNTLFNAFGDEAQMDNAIWDSILKVMIDRLRDVNMNVRQQAVLALQRLQDPGDPEDKVIKTYLFHMETDPSAKVRRAVIAAIAKNQRTIPSVIGRLWDVDETVRRLAYLQMAKYPVTNFKVVQRIQILDQGLNEQSSTVKKCVAQILLPNWIQVYEGNYLSFISGLKIDASETDLEKFKIIAINALQEIFRQKKPDDFINALNLSRQEETKKCVKLESVKTSVEILVMWQAVIKYLTATDVEDVDTVLPDMSVIAEFLKDFIESNYQAVEQGDDTLEQMYFQFEILLLLEIINGYDFDDEIGRQALQTILLEILQKVSLQESCIKVICEILEKLISDSDQRLELLVNIIRGITEQTFTVTFEETNQIVDEHLKANPNVNLMTDLSEIKLEVLELIEKRDTAKERNNHVEALKYQTEIETKQDEYRAKIRPILESSKDPHVITLADSLYNRRRLSPETVSKCLNMCFYMVALKSVKNLTPSVCDLYRKFVCNYLESQEIGYRRLSLRVATTYSMLYETLALDVYRSLGKQLISTSSVVIMKAAIHGIFELLDYYGFEKFQLETSVNRTKKSGRTLYNTNADETEDEETMEQTDLINSLLSVLDKCADDSIVLVSVIGFCRLILHKWITSAEIVAKLLLKFFNPATGNDITQVLGAFFKELITRRQQELLQQALFPTLKQIIDAPSESPLQDVETTKLVQFVINSTRPEYSPPGLNIHNTIALSFFNINKDEPDSESNNDMIKLLAGELHTLEITDSCLRDDFKETVDEFLKDIKDPKIVKSLIKFKEMLNEKGKSTVGSTATSSHAASSLTDDRSDEEDTVSMENQSEDANTDKDKGVFKVPQARQKPNDTFIPSPIPPSTPETSIDTVVSDVSINETLNPTTPELSSQETPLETLVPATQEEESFFLTSTQVGSNIEKGLNDNKTDISEPVTPIKVPKTIETRRSKREHPPNTPSVASPARKVEKKSATPKKKTESEKEEGRATRKTTRTGTNTVGTKSKIPVEAPIKTSRSTRTAKNPIVSIEPLPKRVPKPTEKVKASKETTKSKKIVPVEKPSVSVESPQRLSRTLGAPRTPTNLRVPLVRKTMSAKKVTQEPEIVPETPPSSSRTRGKDETESPKTPKTPKGRTPRSTKAITDSPDVIPGSPIGLIGLRSLTKKNLRSRTPGKKNI